MMQRNEEMNQLGSQPPKIQDIAIPHKSFDYLEGNARSFSYTTAAVTSEYQHYVNQYRFVFCVIIPDDSKKSDDYFKLTLNSIKQNAEDLINIGFESSSIAICAFLLQMTTNETRNLFDFDVPQFDIHSPDSYCCKFMKTKDQSNFLNVFFNYKPFMTSIQAMKCFNARIVNDFSDNNDLFAIITEAGVEFAPNAIRMMISAMNQSDGNKQGKRKMAVVPAFESLGTSLFARMQKYENVHYNMYDLHYYSIACTVPISSKLSMIRITKELRDKLKLFYSDLPLDASQSYHDYKLGVFLEEGENEVSYVPDIIATLTEVSLEFPAYMENYSMRNQGNLAIFFDLGKAFSNCKLCNGNKALCKFILFFQLLGIITDFVFPSLMAEVMYAIFAEAFGPTAHQAAIFFTIFYILLIILSGIYGLMSPRLTGQYRINFIAFFFVFDVYYLFILICSVVAMDNINKKPTDEYSFNVAALVVMIVLNVIFGFIPLVLNFKKVGQNILDLIIYFFLGSPNYTSLFAIHSLFNASDSKGNKDNTSLKAIVLLVFVFANAFFGFLIFVMDRRKTRADCVMALAIVFTIYNAFKMISIIVSKVNCFDPTIINKVNVKESQQLEMNNQVNNNNRQLNRNDDIGTGNGYVKPVKEERKANNTNDDNDNDYDDYDNEIKNKFDFGYNQDKAHPQANKAKIENKPQEKDKNSNSYQSKEEFDIQENNDMNKDKDKDKESEPRGNEEIVLDISDGEVDNPPRKGNNDS